MRIGPGWSKGSELLAIPGLGWRRLTRRGTDRNRPMLGEQRTASFRPTEDARRTSRRI